MSRAECFSGSGRARKTPGLGPDCPRPRRFRKRSTGGYCRRGGGSDCRCCCRSRAPATRYLPRSAPRRIASLWGDIPSEASGGNRRCTLCQPQEGRRFDQFLVWTKSCFVPSEKIVKYWEQSILSSSVQMHIFAKLFS